MSKFRIITGPRPVAGLFLFWVLVFFVFIANSYGDDVFDQLITIQFSDDELGQVLQGLSAETGVQIIYDEKISQKRVSGLYKNVSFLSVLHRLLAGLNYSLVLDTEKRKMVIKGFGKVHYVATGIDISGTHDGNPDLPIKKLHALHAKQTEEFAKQLEDSDEFLDDLGMTRGQLRNLHENQSASFKEEMLDQTKYLVQLGMTHGEHEEMLKKQQIDFNWTMNNDKTVIPILGRTVGEQKAMLAEQTKLYEKQTNDEAEYLEEIGMTRGEHRQLLARQMELFKKKLGR